MKNLLFRGFLLPFFVLPVLLLMSTQTASGTVPRLDPPFTVTNQLFLPNGYSYYDAVAPKIEPFDWLAYVNSIRTLANLAPVSEVSEWSAGDVLHGKYMVKNQVIGHTEEK